MAYGDTTCTHDRTWRVWGTDQKNTVVVVSEDITAKDARNLLSFSSPEDNRYAECDNCGSWIESPAGSIVKAKV